MGYFIVLILFGLWFLHIINRLPFLTLLIQVHEDGIVRVRDTDVTLALVNDRCERLKSVCRIRNGHHFATEKFAAAELRDTIVRERVHIVRLVQVRYRFDYLARS